MISEITSPPALKRNGSSGSRALFDPLTTLFAPRDVELAYRLHGANCGPASFAAFLGRNICDVMSYFPNFPQKPFTNIPRMYAALRQIGIRFSRTKVVFPTHGFVLIQIDGPWTNSKRAVYEAIRHRHWISMRLDHVYEVNLESWVPRDIWQQDYLPSLIKRHEGATGWSICTIFQVEEYELEIGESYGSAFLITQGHALASNVSQPRRKRS